MQKHVAIWSRGENFRPKKPRGVQRTPPASLRVKIQIGWGGGGFPARIYHDATGQKWRTSRGCLSKTSWSCLVLRFSSKPTENYGRRRGVL